MERRHCSEGGTGRPASKEEFQEAVDPSYWPRSLLLRAVIAFCYVTLIAVDVLPMSVAWAAVSGGGLLLYSLALIAIYVRFGLTRPYELFSPYTDTLVVTVAIVALAQPEYPIWMGYFLVIPPLANFHGTRYLLGFSFWSLANCLAAFIVLGVTGRAEVAWEFAMVIAFMAVFTALNSDIISQSNRRLRALVYEASLTDPLTGLDNRRAFRQVLEAHGTNLPHPIAVVMYDLDNFKEINETCGHVYADTILVRVAESLRESFRDADTVARYGGDEMIVLAHVSAIEDAFEMARRSIERVREVVGVTISAGVSVYPLSADTIESAVTEADAALGRAKRGGKARAMLAAPAA